MNRPGDAYVTVAQYDPTPIGRLTCCTHAQHVLHMSKMIQIRHVSDSLHKRLRSRAAMAGMTLSDYLQQELARVATQLTPAELRARLSGMSRTTLHEQTAEAVRSERDGR